MNLSHILDVATDPVPGDQPRDSVSTVRAGSPVVKDDLFARSVDHAVEQLVDVAVAPLAAVLARSSREQHDVLRHKS